MFDVKLNIVEPIVKQIAFNCISCINVAGTTLQILDDEDFLYPDWIRILFVLGISRLKKQLCKW